MSSDSLNSISPIDGRYHLKTKELQKYFSEASLIRYRIKVEIEYFISLCELPLEELKEFELSNLGTNRNDAGRRKALERELEILKERSIILQGEKERDAQLALDKAFNDQTIALLKNISAMEAKLAGKEEEFNMEQKINELKERFGELDAQQIIDLMKIVKHLFL